jgi:hypothetical protein
VLLTQRTNTARTTRRSHLRCLSLLGTTFTDGERLFLSLLILTNKGRSSWSDKQINSSSEEAFSFFYFYFVGHDLEAILFKEKCNAIPKTVKNKNKNKRGCIRFSYESKKNKLGSFLNDFCKGNKL